MIDHIILGAPTLQSGIQFIENKLGLRPVSGGSHPGFGTHNALLGLGEGVYLEIIAPDPEQPDAARPLWMGLDQVKAPRLIRWAAKSSQLETLCRRAALNGVDLGAVFPGSRATPDGRMLEWQLTDPRKEIAGGLVPFFIDWGSSAHPADALPQAGLLTELWAEHPQPESVKKQLAILGLDLRVESGHRPQLYATISRPGLEIQLGLKKL